MSEDRYHHGDLRRALLDRAFEVVAERGIDALHLRDLARRTGVSHSAPAHHFGDRAALLRAMAEEAQASLADALTVGLRASADVAELGIAYVRWAVARPGHAQILTGTSQRWSSDAFAPLNAAIEDSLPGRTAREHQLALVKAWSTVQGLMFLWHRGAIPAGLPQDPVELTREVLQVELPSQRRTRLAREAEGRQDNG